MHPHNIKIYHECEGRIEKSVPRIAVWHHEACRVITNGDTKGRIFLTRIKDYFSCSPLFLFVLLHIYLFIYIFIYLFVYLKKKLLEVPE